LEVAFRGRVPERLSCGKSNSRTNREVAKDLDEDKMVVVILPDAGSRYLSKIFNDEWMKEKGFLP